MLLACAGDIFHRLLYPREIYGASSNVLLRDTHAAKRRGLGKYHEGGGVGSDLRGCSADQISDHRQAHAGGYGRNRGGGYIYMVAGRQFFQGSDKVSVRDKCRSGASERMAVGADSRIYTDICGCIYTDDCTDCADIGRGYAYIARQAIHGRYSGRHRILRRIYDRMHGGSLRDYQSGDAMDICYLGVYVLYACLYVRLHDAQPGSTDSSGSAADRRGLCCDRM